MEERSKSIQAMFDGIAGRYDFLNRLLSFRRDVVWRKEAIKAAEIESGHRVLDLACGTGDMMLEIGRRAPGARVTGGDFSLNMLVAAKNKIPDGFFTAADAHSLPFVDEAFDRITIAFGFRNVTDKSKGLYELYRVLKNGGKLIILEFSEPENKAFAALYRFYFKKILPLIGGLISGNRNAYEYLPDSVYKFPKRPEYGKMIADAGFKNLRFIPMTFGIITITVINK